MNACCRLGLGWVLALAACATAQADTVDARCDLYPKGSDKARAVLACQFSQRQGFISITRADGVRHELQPKGGAGNYIDQDGRPAQRVRGLGQRGQIFRMAGETVYVYWDTAGLPAAAPASAASAVSSASTRLPPPAPVPRPFDQTLQLQGIRFHVHSANAASTGEVRITPTGLAISNEAVVRPLDGWVTGAEVADLDADGSPEVYVYVSSAGSGSYGSLVAVAANRRKSLSDITLPPLQDHPGAAQGYQGHDQFAVVEGALARRFPLYRSGDTQAQPSGGVRQLRYRLVPGEAGWRLQVERMTEF